MKPSNNKFKSVHANALYVLQCIKWLISNFLTTLDKHIRFIKKQKKVWYVWKFLILQSSLNCSGKFIPIRCINICIQNPPIIKFITNLLSGTPIIHSLNLNIHSSVMIIIIINVHLCHFKKG